MGEEWAANAVMLSMVAVLAAVLYAESCRDTARTASRHADRMCDKVDGLNPYARYLGRRVSYRKYEASEWETGTVVAVSWHGSVCIRRDGDEAGRWIDDGLTNGRVMPL